MKTIILVMLLANAAVALGQQAGSKVIFKTDNGSYYTGTVKEVMNNKYRVLYDNTNFEAWMTADQFSVAANPAQYTQYNTPEAPKTNTQVADDQPETKQSNNTVPTRADIIAALRKTWEKEKSGSSPKTTVTVNSITIGTSAKSNLAQQFDGIPKNATVTHAKIDFTENKFYTTETRQVRRIMTGLVYRNQFNEWTIMNAGTVYP